MPRLVLWGELDNDERANETATERVGQERMDEIGEQSLACMKATKVMQPSDQEQICCMLAKYTVGEKQGNYGATQIGQSHSTPDTEVRH